MSGSRIDRPVFFIGMPRSGTTVMFEAFAARPDVAWFSQHLERLPGLPAVAFLSRITDVAPAMRSSVSRSDQLRPWLERLRVGPSEAYSVWERCCGKKFLYDYLLNTEATQGEAACLRTMVSRVLRFQGKARFAAKITGPGRIRYLSSVFPDARFVHVLRDGRAVVQSLMQVSFWRERARMQEPAWRNGLTEDDLAAWERYDRSPLALAAVQWRRVVESARDEAARIAPDRYAEVCYERFVVEPYEALDEVASFCQLQPSSEALRFLRGRFELRDMNYQWREQLEPDDIATLSELIGPTLEELGYEIDPPRSPVGRSRVAQPFAALKSRA